VSRWPLRVRLTLAFALVMSVVLTVTGLFVFSIFRGDLNGSIDRSLTARSGEVTDLVRHVDDGLLVALRKVSGGSDRDFAQIVAPDGSIVAATPQVAHERLLAGPVLSRAARKTLVFQHPEVPRLDGTLRLRTAPVNTARGRMIVAVGTALGERDDSLRTLGWLLAAGGFVALLLASLAGYGVASGALRPVEAMRRRAAEIAPGSGPGGRLPVPGSGDEVARLGTTLNEMLARLEAAFERERTFAADASHELRMPLGILKTELELALRRGRSPEELRAAIASAAEETDRLVQLAEDLLVIARLDDGKVPLRTADLDAADLLEHVAARFGVDAESTGPIPLRGDSVRLEQALGNIADNARRHGGGAVRLSALRRDHAVELHVVDDGPGFDPEFIEHAFERFARADGARSRGGSGLGLAIVAAIATSHGGVARAANRPGGGADVWIELPTVGAAPRDPAAPALVA
jgi:signal transduction histidine kinase